VPYRNVHYNIPSKETNAFVNETPSPSVVALANKLKVNQTKKDNPIVSTDWNLFYYISLSLENSSNSISLYFISYKS